MLNLFSLDEITGYLDNHQRDLLSFDTQMGIRFIKRAVFLDMGTVCRVNRVGAGPRGIPFFRFYLRSPVDESGKTVVHQPDFASWTKYKREKITGIIKYHSMLPAVNEKSFFAGGLDQAMGNLDGFSGGLVRLRKWISTAKSSSNPLESLADNLAGEKPTFRSDSNVNLSDDFSSCIAWSIAVACCAISLRDRSVFRDFEIRKKTSPSKSESLKLSREILKHESNKLAISSRIDSALDFCRLIQGESWHRLADAKRPELISWDVSTSWTSWWYGAITTNPSYNPLSSLARVMAESKFPGYSFLGFPKKRSAPLTLICPKTTENLEWNIIAVNGNSCAFVEPRSITKNHLGDKSKEIFDRIGQSRLACVDAEITDKYIGILDGDFDSTDVIADFSSKFGYTEIIKAENFLCDEG